MLFRRTASHASTISVRSLILRLPHKQTNISLQYYFHNTEEVCETFPLPIYIKNFVLLFQVRVFTKFSGYSKQSSEYIVEKLLGDGKLNVIGLWAYEGGFQFTWSWSRDAEALQPTQLIIHSHTSYGNSFYLRVCTRAREMRSDGTCYCSSGGWGINLCQVFSCMIMEN